MEKRIELQVTNIMNSQTQAGAFAMILGEVDGERQLPVIIGAVEAQSIVMYLKGIRPPRPLTHDLFVNTINALGAELIRTLIYKARQGIFYSYLYLKREKEIIRIDARTSDAVALAVRAGCPILVKESVLEQERLLFPGEKRPSDSETTDEKGTDNNGSYFDSLETALEEAVKSENYELAARIRDRIKMKKQNTQ